MSATQLAIDFDPPTFGETPVVTATTRTKAKPRVPRLRADVQDNWATSFQLTAAEWHSADRRGGEQNADVRVKERRLAVTRIEGLGLEVPFTFPHKDLCP